VSEAPEVTAGRVPITAEEPPVTTVRVGLALGIAFTICFVTGVISHLIQHPPTWFSWPAHPVWLYRVTQGLHVLSGITAIPLLLVKLAIVYRKLFERPLIGSPVRMAERLSIAVLVASGVFELVTGLMNTAHWYPWKFFFPAAHHAVAYVAIGAVAIHIAVKLPVIRAALGEHTEIADGTPDSEKTDTAPADKDPGPTRRTVLTATVIGVGVAFVAFAGATITPLRRLAFLSPRSGDGPQGVPINRTAETAGVSTKAVAPDYRLTIAAGAVSRSLALSQLKALPQRRVRLPIACVEGWSASAEWSGIRLSELLTSVGAVPGTGARMVSLERGSYAVTDIPATHAWDDLTLIALTINGDQLSLDHGYPARLIAPNLPGVMQTKWLERIEVLS
jgi:hypothetical protein